MSEVLPRKASSNVDGEANDRDNALRRSLTVPKCVTEEEKTRELVYSELDWKAMLDTCDNLLKSITKKLIYMPLSMRYLCKLVEKLAKKHVLLGNATISFM
jgi:hypothetical protein